MKHHGASPGPQTCPQSCDVGDLMAVTDGEEQNMALAAPWKNNLAGYCYFTLTVFV